MRLHRSETRGKLFPLVTNDLVIVDDHYPSNSLAPGEEEEEEEEAESLEPVEPSSSCELVWLRGEWEW